MIMLLSPIENILSHLREKLTVVTRTSILLISKTRASELSRLWLIHPGEISHEGPKWDAKTKATIVREGLKGKPVIAICQDYNISRAQYYQSRNQLFFECAKHV